MVVLVVVVLVVVMVAVELVASIVGEFDSLGCCF